MSYPDEPHRPRRTVVLSDVHLSQAHPEDPSDPMWMRYRRREHHPDDDYAALIDHLIERFPDDDIELVWNGDVLDFDAPWVKDGDSSFDEYPLTEDGCAAQARRILDDHPGVCAATARLLAAGHRLLVLSGNHDLALFFPAVRREVRSAIASHLPAQAVDARIRFRAWFHVTEDRIYLEHGSQYDMFSCVPHAMIPLTRARDRLHPVFSNLAFKRTGSRMGYFNPYYEETFYLGLFGYLQHYWAHYARSSHRHIFRVWFRGGLITAREIWRHRRGEDRAAEARGLACAETGARPEDVDATQALRVRPAEDTMLPILRELWLDRVAFGAITLAASIAALAAGGPIAGAFALAFLIALFVAYEIITPKPDLRTFDAAPPSVKALFGIHDARALCMGHTHRPFGVWDGDRFHGNSGSWAPAFEDHACTRPVLPRRPLLMLVARGSDKLSGGLWWWGSGELTPDPQGARLEPVLDRSARPD